MNHSPGIILYTLWGVEDLTGGGGYGIFKAFKKHICFLLKPLKLKERKGFSLLLHKLGLQERYVPISAYPEPVISDALNTFKTRKKESYFFVP